MIDLNESNECSEWTQPLVRYSAENAFYKYFKISYIYLQINIWRNLDIFYVLP